MVIRSLLGLAYRETWNLKPETSRAPNRWVSQLPRRGPFSGRSLGQSVDSLSVTSPQLGKKFARGGLCPRAATTETSSWVRQQGSTVQSVPALSEL